MIRLTLVLLFVVSFLLVSLILIPVGYLIGLFSMPARDRYAQAMISWAFRVVGVLAGAKVTVKGKENVPKEEAVLYVANHRGMFDIVLLYAQMFRATAIVAKKEIKKVPILSWWMILMRCRQSGVHQHGVVVVNHGVVLAVQQEYRCLEHFRMSF